MRYAMRPKPQHPSMFLTRRRLLQGTLSSAAGLLAWQQGWPRLRDRCCPETRTQWADDLGNPYSDCPHLV
jgi:hypothetical protein